MGEDQITHLGMEYYFDPLPAGSAQPASTS